MLPSGSPQPEKIIAEAARITENLQNNSRLNMKVSFSKINFFKYLSDYTPHLAGKPA
jgi:hypothetical protein